MTKNIDIDDTMPNDSDESDESDDSDEKLIN